MSNSQAVHRIIFLSSRSALIFFLSKAKLNKVLQQTNKQKKQQKTIFLSKINKIFLSPILQNLKGRSVWDTFSFKNDPLGEPKKMPLSKKFYTFRKLVKNAKSNLPLSKCFPLKTACKITAIEFLKHFPQSEVVIP